MEEERLELRLGIGLRSRGLTVAFAESCTGGLIGHRITNIPGSSDYYRGSVTAYANLAKERLLGVKAKTLAAHGAVSRETVLEMAFGIRRALGADIGASVSGIAGPGGATPGKPVGLVWIGLAAPVGAWARRFQFTGDREAVKAQAADEALRFVQEYLEGLKDDPR